MEDRTKEVVRDVKRERRRAIRNSCGVRVRMVIQVAAAGDRANTQVEMIDVKARLIDVTTESATIATKHDFDKGQQLQVIISLPGLRPLDVDATVHWSKALPKNGLYAAGARFYSIQPDDRVAIEKFLARLDAELEQAEV